MRLVVEIVYRTWPVLGTTALYMVQCCLYLRDGNKGLAFAFFGYALANAGLIAASLSGSADHA